MTSEEQLSKWVDGVSVHANDECVPDFSCCHKQLLADVAIRRAFVKADKKTKSKFLAHFLGSLLEWKIRGKKVTIIAGDLDDI